MVPPRRLALLAIGAACIVTGLGSGAQAQHERFLGPDGGGDTIIRGEPIAVTGLLVATGVVVLAFALAPHANQRRGPATAIGTLLAATVVFLASYLATFLLQTAGTFVVTAAIDSNN